MNNDTNEITQSLQTAVIGCLPIDGVIEECSECGKLSLFIKTLKCYICGCDSPFGSYYDDDISDLEIEEYLKNTVYIGLISELKDELSIRFINSL